MSGTILRIRLYSYKFKACRGTTVFLVFLIDCTVKYSVPVAARSRAEVCGRSPAETLGLNPTRGMDVCLL